MLTMVLNGLLQERVFIKVNIDEAWNNAAILAGFGVILCDSAGTFYGGAVGPIGCQSALISEAESALTGLKLAAHCGHQRAILESNSKVFVDGLNDKKGNTA